MGAPFLEISTDEHQVSKEFFAAVFGWNWSDADRGRFETADGPVGLHGGDVPMVVPYFRVANVQAVVERVKEQGGRVVGGIRREAGVGSFAVCIDPRGVRFGLHRPEQP